MPLGQKSHSCSSRFAGMLAGVAYVALWSTGGCGHSEGRDSSLPTKTVTLGNEASSDDSGSSEAKKHDADIVPASNEQKTRDAEPTPAESVDQTANSAATSPTEKPAAVPQPTSPDAEATRTFAVEGPEGAIRISFDDFDLLKVMNLDPVPADAVEKLPKWLKALDGKRIRVRGFMYPPFQDSGIRGFVLARDNQICCFGRTPKEYDLVDTFLRKGVTTNYIQNRPFDVVGIFRIKSEIEKFTAMYELEDAIVIEK